MLAWRPLITIAFILLGLGLAQPGRAQMMSLYEIAQAAGGVEQDKPAPVIVADTVNHAAISFDGVERAFTDALTGELKETYTFAPVERAAVEAATKELGLVPPYSIESQVLLAEKLQCAYVITSTIDSAKIVKSSKGTCAEVQFTTAVVSRVTQQQQTSAHAIIRSSSQASQPATDALMREALDRAVSYILGRLLSIRIPCATVLTGCTMSDEMILRGGSQIGIKKGMILITVRRGQPTGKMTVFRVNLAESYANILEDSKGIAAGDIAIPAYYYDPPFICAYPRPRPRNGLLALFAVSALFVLAGSR